MLTLKRIIEFKYREVEFKYQVVEIDCCEDVLVFVDVLRLKVEEVGFFLIHFPLKNEVTQNNFTFE